MDRDEATDKLLDTAEALFYERGIQAVGMAELRTASGVSLKRFYQCFASKDELVEAYLRRRDARWLAALAAHVERSSEQPALAVFDWLHEWFGEPGFRGCAFLNSFGELGGVAPAVAEVAREHKQALHDYLRGLVERLDVADPGRLAEQLLILVEGAIATAAVHGRADAARAARSAAAALVDAAPRERMTGATIQY
ncbi:DNA-binding transcriptional regulator, AcrR family [Saccharopolyspora antimicrobica]|uniref:DNA-binding transcriptional regulator, AcrR family n=1 Tax=Saccharopolyspora antimicrobica TaxID=455193 RepID=A0A1I4VIG6_9PSEU|nr:TetR/AcrR family transcriptional regulator [Saccharopolyspora antimicrobica]RKT86324.1 TetR family transcriptional regulator [Saccharopolyspora antimicrobica]SFN00923.1 DNA-binding transcriptional regulator, AcrR family [Saccharopolyspora antimicrobica]